MSPEVKRPVEVAVFIHLNDFDSEMHGREVWDVEVELGGRRMDLTTVGSPGEALDYVWRWAKQRNYGFADSASLSFGLLCNDEYKRRYDEAVAAAHAAAEAEAARQTAKRLGKSTWKSDHV